jgi:Fic-DOC domain mobile mystery protein B
MGFEIEYLSGQTPIDEEEKEGLLIKPISTRAELDEFEQLNIQSAIKWTIGKKFKAEEILTEEFVNRLHRRMFDQVWAWAGEFRKSNKNIGVDKFQIPMSLRTLLDDCKHWIKNGTYSPDEIALRFKHAIVNIHCYPNGNGRHSRLLGDILIENVFQQPIFTWGSGANLVQGNEARKQYLLAIKEADKGNLHLLLKFARL